MPILSPMTNDVELPWENGELAMQGHESASDTLESIILQATACYSRRQNLDVDPQQSQNFDVDQQQCQNFDVDPRQDTRRLHHKSSIITSSSGKYHESSGPSYAKKRQCLRNLAATSFKDDIARIKSKDNGMTWPPFESSNQDNQDSECKIQSEKVRSHSTQQRRAAAIHNQSERRRREKINQKLRDLQKLLPDSDKARNTDKASMLDKAIVYLKKLKAQVDLMKNIPMLPQMAFQLQQQQQMWMLAGMQMGIPGVMSPAAHHPFMAPQTMISPAHVAVMPQPSHGFSASTASVPLGDPYSRFLAQVSSCGPGN